MVIIVTQTGCVWITSEVEHDYIMNTILTQNIISYVIQVYIIIHSMTDMTLLHTNVNMKVSSFTDTWKEGYFKV
jgi:hypothetical protein